MRWTGKRRIRDGSITRCAASGETNYCVQCVPPLASRTPPIGITRNGWQSTRRRPDRVHGPDHERPTILAGRYITESARISRLRVSCQT
jgi:hypothetical protein